MRWWMVCLLGALACGAQQPSTTEPSTTEDTSGGDTADASGAEGSSNDDASLPFASLHAGDTLTYLVQGADGDHRAFYYVHEVVRRGPSVAVRLRPVGAPVGDSLVIFGGWLVAGVEGMLALEPHVTLGQPGFVPIDEAGRLVTEARGMVAWRVPPRWQAADARAFETDPVDGWRLAGSEPSVPGPVAGESCVRLERREAASTLTFVVCRNVGIFAMERRGEGDASDGSWRLVDLGASSGELEERPLGAPVEMPPQTAATP
ncbi:MAG: hypothetical protein MUE69_31120 [Myxococcota bacterium]|jgi:hypothetical protein|nr:hypothetical protein [Myxococcota bacterium]